MTGQHESNLERCRSLPRRHTLRRVLIISVVALMTIVFRPIPAAAATELIPSESDYVARINDLRVSKGLNALIVDDDLMSLSREHTEEMLSTQDLHHTSNLITGVQSVWEKLGENVGVGSNSDVLWTAFVNSPHHYENLVDPAYTHVGVGVSVDGNAVQWTT